MEKALKVIADAQTEGAAEYLVAIMLQTYRPKDKDRLLKFLQETSLDFPLLNSILRKHNLVDSFDTFKRQYYGNPT